MSVSPCSHCHYQLKQLNIYISVYHVTLSVSIKEPKTDSWCITPIPLRNFMFFGLFYKIFSLVCNNIYCILPCVHSSLKMTVQRQGETKTLWQDNIDLFQISSIPLSVFVFTVITELACQFYKFPNPKTNMQFPNILFFPI